MISQRKKESQVNLLQGWMIVWGTQQYFPKIQTAMDIGSAIAIFVVLAVVLMVLFCLLLKYYSYKIKHQHRNRTELCEIDESIHEDSCSAFKGAYDEYKEKRSAEKKQKNLQQEQFQFELPEIRQVLDISNNIYGLSTLRRRLQDETTPLPLSTLRTISSLKEINITKLTGSSTAKEKQYHSYTQKLVSHQPTGIIITELCGDSLKRQQRDCKILGKIQNIFYSDQSNDFVDQLEAHGFSDLNFGCYKYTHKIDITDVKIGEIRSLKGLSGNISKQQISIENFQLQKINMQSARK